MENNTKNRTGQTANECAVSVASGNIYAKLGVFFCGPPTLWARPDRFVRSRTYYTMSTRYVLRAIAGIGARARA